VETAAKTLRDLRVAEVNKLDLMIVDAKSPLSARG
jgi:flavin-binding protein dodecin